MSNLLQSVLTSRLANASLSESQGGVGNRDRQSNSSSSTSTTPEESTSPNPQYSSSSSSSRFQHQPHQPQGLEDWESIDPMTSSSSDDEMVGVISVPATVPGTPFNISRPSSPPTFSTLSASHFSEEGRVEPNRTKTLDQDSGRIGSSSKAVGKQASSTTSKRKANANSASSSSSKYSRLDPLRAFNSEISQHIFLQLPQSALVSCSMVSKRWRRSATLNYCWYRLYQHTFNSHSVVDGPWQQPSLPAWGSGGAKWTRRESRTDWKTTFAKGRKMEAREQERYESLPGSGAVTPSRTQRMSEAGILTATEWREEQWRSQHEERWSKNEMREHYKSFSKGGKLKGKSAKGGVKTGSANDGSLWE